MADVVGLQEQVFRSLDELCSSLDGAEWEASTGCPGWSVKDNLSHIVGTESTLLGRSAPDHDPGVKPWVKNPIGESNEVWVDHRRSWPAEKVLEEFREVASERIDALKAMSEDDLDGESWTPIGQGTVRDLLAIRVMDCWVHEQDIRRAVGRPGGLDGPLAQHAFERHAGAMGFVVGKKAGAPDGSAVVFDVSGMPTVAIGVDGRAKPLDAAPDEATVKLSMDLETFSCLCCGREDISDLADRVRIEGDGDLGRQIVANMNFMI